MNFFLLIASDCLNVVVTFSFCTLTTTAGKSKLLGKSSSSSTKTSDGATSSTIAGTSCNRSNEKGLTLNFVPAVWFYERVKLALLHRKP